MKAANQHPGSTLQSVTHLSVKVQNNPAAETSVCVYQPMTKLTVSIEDFIWEMVKQT